MPTIAPTRGLLSSLDVDPLTLANRVLKHMNAYHCPAFPSRPELGVDDGHLITLFQKWDDKKAMAAADKDVLQTFGIWRSMVFRMETEASGHLQLLMTAIINLEANDQSAADLRSFVEMSYEVQLPRVIHPSRVRQLAEKLSFRMDLVPKYLRTMDLADAPKEVRAQRKKSKEVSVKNLSMADAYGDEQ